jgi:hypothetical protein
MNAGRVVDVTMTISLMKHAGRVWKGWWPQGGASMLAILLCVCVQPSLPHRNPCASPPPASWPSFLVGAQGAQSPPLALSYLLTADWCQLSRLRGGAEAEAPSGESGERGEALLQERGLEQRSSSLLGGVWKHLQAVAEVVTPAKPPEHAADTANADLSDTADLEPADEATQLRKRSRAKKKARRRKKKARLAADNTTEYRAQMSPTIRSSPTVRIYSDFVKDKLLELRSQQPDTQHNTLMKTISALWREKSQSSSPAKLPTKEEEHEEQEEWGGREQQQHDADNAKATIPSPPLLALPSTALK